MLNQGGNLRSLYQEAIDYTNSVITAYKITPYRHNHDLRPVTIENRPSQVTVIRFDIFSGKLIEHAIIAMHGHMLSTVIHARKLEKKELSNFAISQVGFNSQFQLPELFISKIYEAIDARCLGNYQLSVILADTYVEHVIRYFLFQILLQNGLNFEEASRKLDQIRFFNDLLSQLAKKLGLTTEKLKEVTNYEEWNNECRKNRNEITHNFLTQPISPAISKKAIIKSIKLIIDLSDIVEKKYPSSRDYVHWFRSISWYLANLDKEEETIDKGIKAFIEGKY